MNFNIYNSLILAGIIQGLAFALAVVFNERLRHKSTFYLLGVVTVYSLSNLQFYLCDIEAINYTQLYSYFYIPWGNLVPPLLYMYAVTYLNPERTFTNKEKLLFLPFTISFFISLVFKVLAIWPTNFTKALKSLWVYLESYDELISIVFHIIVIAVLIRMVSIYKKNNEIFNPNHINRDVRWLSITLKLLFIGVLVWLAIIVSYMFNAELVSFYPLWIIMAFLIYWYGYLGVHKYGILQERIQIRKKSKVAQPQKDESAKSTIIERLKNYLVGEKQYLDANLSLVGTAEALGVSQGHLSKTINNEMQISFKDYVNGLRVEEAKRYLLDSTFSNYTLLAIGLEAGFNSKSTFNASFKKIVGVTPSQFKKNNRK